MKKIVFVLVFLLSLFGCSAYKTTPFIIDNNSDWNIVVSVKNCYETGKKRSHLNYMIKARSSYTLNLYINGECELISVNGAKIIKYTSSELILENDTPKKISVINLTEEDVALVNKPMLPCPLNYHYADAQYYIPIFKPMIINKNYNSEISAKELYIYAWQMKFCKTNEDLNNIAIKIATSNNCSYKFKIQDDNIFLILFN